MTRADPGRTEGFAPRLFHGLPPRYDRLAEILSLGQNGRWRQAMVDPVVAASPRTVLDVATGPAGVAIQIAQRTEARVTGVDLTPEMLAQAARNVTAGGWGPRIALVRGRGEQLPFPDGCFDALTFTYLLRYVEDPEATVAELVRVVRPGGVVASLEFHPPHGPVFRPLWWLYTRTVLPLAGYALGGKEWFDVGRFLGPSISGHYARYPVEWHLRTWRQAGVADVRARIMSVGGGLVMWGRKS